MRFNASSSGCIQTTLRTWGQCQPDPKNFNKKRFHKCQKIGATKTGVFFAQNTKSPLLGSCPSFRSSLHRKIPALSLMNYKDHGSLEDWLLTVVSVDEYNSTHYHSYLRVRRDHKHPCRSQTPNPLLHNPLKKSHLLLDITSTWRPIPIVKSTLDPWAKSWIHTWWDSLQHHKMGLFTQKETSFFCRRISVWLTEAWGLMAGALQGGWLILVFLLLLCESPVRIPSIWRT